MTNTDEQPPAGRPGAEPFAPYALLTELAAHRTPDRPALTFQGRTWTYAQLDAVVRNAVATLEHAGITAGMRVLLLMENRPEYLVCQFALARIGAAFACPNPYWTAHEIGHAAATLDAAAAIHSDRHRGTAEGYRIAVDVAAIVLDADTTPPGEPVREQPDPAGELCIPFSSGTTGLPKGVVHTHASLSGGIGILVDQLALTDRDKLQISLPLCHIFGTSMLGAAIAAGAHVTLFERFDFDECLRQLKTGEVTVWPLAGTVAHRLASMPQISRADFPALRYFMWGGSAVPQQLAAAITGKTGVGFLCSYGMTEAFAPVFNPVGEPEQWRLDSPGFPAPGMEIRLGTDDEIELRGPCVARSYTVQPSREEDDPFGPDGWFRTGDIGRIDDDGRVWIVDRRKDMIKVSGFQVAPTEVEAELLRHPSVTDAAVIGEPDDRRGERVVAYVVTSAPAALDEVRATASERLATYKIPDQIIAVDSLPRSDSGKLQRARLRRA
ncbi:AMP-binding protein [Gordonia sp. HNM0687]|uniref:AMP-binding protein n=1 Tax=Gordonia mangrovi TaxID=2665643 RepID=A0A6L7GWW1_9ACTN|nr:class I adenylate-forming enzyme family protein [Gordonia mangrovi]MXP23511.1 AMP-binding protein [Gordonia mangrovi]UVF76595.1 acyl--CoA ligase [Gordonia mangrovi]